MTVQRTAVAQKLGRRTGTSSCCNGDWEALIGKAGLRNSPTWAGCCPAGGILLGGGRGFSAGGAKWACSTYQVAVRCGEAFICPREAGNQKST